LPQCQQPHNTTAPYSTTCPTAIVFTLHGTEHTATFIQLKPEFITEQPIAKQ
jgi:hypothetical protein